MGVFIGQVENVSGGNRKRVFPSGVSRAWATATTNGAVNIVGRTAGQFTNVLGAIIEADAAMSVQFLGSTGTTISPRIPLVADTPLIIPATGPQDYAWFKTATATTLQMNFLGTFSGGDTARVHIMYNKTSS